MLSVSSSSSTLCRVWASPRNLVVSAGHELHLFDSSCVVTRGSVELLPAPSLSHPDSSAAATEDLLSCLPLSASWDGSGDVFVMVDRVGRMKAIDGATGKVLYTKELPGGPHCVGGNWNIAFAATNGSSFPRPNSPQEAAAGLMAQQMYVMSQQSANIYRFFGGTGGTKVGVEVVPIGTSRRTDSV